MRPPRPLLVVAALVVGSALTACGDGGARAGGATTPTASPTSSPAGSPTGTPAGEPTPTPSARTDQEAPMRIGIDVDGETFTATLDDSTASRDLLSQLPVDVEMSDHGGVEKTGRLPRPLSLDGQPDVGDPAVGDLGYYAPGQDLVLYYGDQSAFPGIVVLGRLEGDAAERLAAMPGSVNVRVSARES